jgi:hypothetical protein
MKENMHMRSKINQEFYHGIVIYIYCYIVIYEERYIKITF